MGYLGAQWRAPTITVKGQKSQPDPFAGSFSI